MKFTYRIPIEWSLCEEVTVEAESLEDAIQLANEVPLPSNGEYIDGSFEVREEIVEECNPFIREVRRIDTTPRDQLPLLIGKLKTEEAQRYLETRIKELST